MKDEFKDLFGESGDISYMTQCTKHKLRFYGHKGEVRSWNCPKCPKKKVHLDPNTKFWLDGRKSGDDLSPAERKPLLPSTEAGEFKGIKIYYSIEYDIDKDWYIVRYRADVNGERYTINHIEKDKTKLKEAQKVLHSEVLTHIHLQTEEEEKGFMIIDEPVGKELSRKEVAEHRRFLHDYFKNKKENMTDGHK